MGCLKVRCRCECRFSNLSGVLHEGFEGHEHNIKKQGLAKEILRMEV